MTTYEEIKKLSEGQSRKLSPEESKALWYKIYTEALLPNREAILKIVNAGEIAVVTWDLHSTCIEGAQDLGYDGETPVFRMKNRSMFAEELRRVRDYVSARWLTRDSKDRVFLMAQLGTFLLNLTEKGFTVEPGSMDHELPEDSIQQLIDEWAQKN